MASTRSADLSAANTRLDDTAGSVVGAGVAAAVVGLGAAGALLLLGKADAGHFGRVWIQNLMFVLSLCLGGLFFVIIQHLTRAGWSVVVRRIAEAFAANLRWIWILFLPIAALAVFGKLGQLFPWADLHQLAQEGASRRDRKPSRRRRRSSTRLLLHPLRSVRGVGCAWRVAWSRSNRGTRPRIEACVEITQRMQTTAAPGILLFGLTATFAAFDWLMSAQSC
ncbi:MAG: hypothetical protein U0575_15780 [Phycisphaerales bacterium]